MLRRSFLALAALATLAGLTWIATVIWPAPAARLLTHGLYLSAGLEKRTTATPAGPVHYLSGGTGETVVFLHGIYARKEHWIDLSRHLSDRYRVILLDLPGFGENPVLPEGAYAYTRQAESLRATLDSLGLDRVHLAANSMGGQIAAMLARAEPERVRSLAFIGGPHGVASPQPSAMEKALAQGERPLVVTSRAAYEARMEWLFPDPPYIPAPIATTWAREEAARSTANRRIWEEVIGSATPPLQALAPDLRQPALILWCTKDRIFDHSGAAVLEAALPNARRESLKGCGHLPMLDRPDAAGERLRRFLDGLGAADGKRDR